MDVLHVSHLYIKHQGQGNINQLTLEAETPPVAPMLSGASLHRSDWLLWIRDW
jgi:hypothetical protein